MYLFFSKRLKGERVRRNPTVLYFCLNVRHFTRDRPIPQTFLLDGKDGRDRAGAVKDKRVVHRDILVRNQLDHLLTSDSSHKGRNVMDRSPSETAAVKKL